MGKKKGEEDEREIGRERARGEKEEQKEREER